MDLRRLAVVAICLLVAATACQPAQTSVPSAPAGPTKVVLRIQGDWNLDVWTQQAALPGYQIFYTTQDSLLAYDPQTWKLIPYVAESWTSTPDSVTFKLRNDVTCNDGTRLGPTAVADFFKWRTSDPIRNNIIPGVSAIGKGPYVITADEAAGTVTFKSGEPKRLLVNNLGTVALLCPAGFAPGADRANKIYGSGPYAIESSVHGDNIVFKKRPDWKWGPKGTTSKDLPDELIYKVVVNDTTAANLISTGGLDVAVMGGSDVGRLQADPNLVETAFPTYTTDTMLINQYPESLFADQALRKAIMTAIDPRGWDKAANDGRGQYSTSYLTKGHPCYDPVTERLAPNPPSIAAGKAVLQAAGYTPGADGKLQKGGKSLPAVKVLGSTQQNSGPEYIGAVIDQLGFKTDVAKLPLTEYVTRRLKFDWDVLLAVGASANPNTASAGSAETVREGGSSINTVMDATAHRIAKDMDTGAIPADQLCKVMADYQEMIWNNNWLLPLTAPPYYVFSRKEKGITFAHGWGGFGTIATWSLRVTR